MKKTFIYSLSSPIDGQIKYIGKSNDPKSRFRKHKSCSYTNKGNNSLKNEWIKSLLDVGLLPILNIIEEVDISEWKIKEKYYVKFYKEKGFELLNINGGGNGPSFGNSGSFKGNPVAVICLDKSGNYVKTFNSIKEGKNFCGKRIDGVLTGRKKTAGGFIWIYKKIYDNLSEIELQEIVKNANTNNSSKNGILTRWKKGDSSWNKGMTGGVSKKRKKVFQYSIDDEFIRVWDCAKLAAQEFSCSTSNITQCALGIIKSAVGYKWKYH